MTKKSHFHIQNGGLGFWISVSGLVAFYIIISCKVLSIFPPLSGDEITGFVGARSFCRGQSYHNPLFDDVLSPEVKPYLQNTISAGRPLYMLWLGACISILPTGWIAARLASVIAGSFMILFVALTGKNIHGRYHGILSAAFLFLFPPFWITSTVVNELIVAGCATAGLVWYLSTDIISSRWGSFFFGLMSPLPALIHPFGLLLVCAVWILGVGTRQKSFFKNRGLVITGLMIGGAIVVMGAPWQVRTQNPFLFLLAQPPLFSHLSLTNWERHIQSFFTKMTSFYYPGAEKQIWGLSESIFFMWIAFGLAILSHILAPFKRISRSIFMAFIFLVVAFLVGVARLEAGYCVLLFPFVIPLIIIEMPSCREKTSFMSRVLSGTITLFCFFSLFSLWIFAKKYIPTYKPHDEISREVMNLAGLENHRVMAPSILLFDFQKSDFRDVSALSNSLYFTQGVFDPKNWLQHWHPDIIIMNSAFYQFLAKRGPPAAILSSLLGIPVEYRGTVKTGTVEGDLNLLALDWQTDLRS